ncbi:hypothetical protein A0H81_06091 [Grifola frondosa]|uniref:Thioesterase domain-containing protein n=1 Tax=Grifola frondosa TaxID=5627 RepID=A0A1C7MAR9_GRIFR|nr:hypothetical protein A0H81_06091 [Grifola frondosa]
MSDVEQLRRWKGRVLSASSARFFIYTPPTSATSPNSRSAALYITRRNELATSIAIACHVTPSVLAKSAPPSHYHYHVPYPKFRVFLPVFQLRGRYLLLRAYGRLFYSREARAKLKAEWHESISPIGSNPFEMSVSYRTWAGPDDCDFNLHLSNSCYAKNLDAARFKTALAYFPTFFRAGGWLGLGATHYSFLREIPIFSRYEIRLSMMSWDNKWIYVVIRYVTLPPKRKRTRTTSPNHKSTATFPPADAAPFPTLHTGSGLATPSGPGTLTPPTAAALVALAAREEPDGATLHCLSISEMCCKVGRITVPPPLVLAADARGSLETLRAFYAGGWREVPEGARWWENALGREIEERRLAGLGCVQAVRRGMEEARTIV